MNDLIDPKEISIEVFNRDGTSAGTKKYVLSQIPYASGGREILSQFLPSAMPKIGDYKVNEELMLKMLGFVAVITDNGQQIKLSTKTLIDNHVPNFQVGLRLEKEMLEYNYGFFELWKNLPSSETLQVKLRPWVTKISTLLKELSSQKEEQPSTN